MAFFPDAQQPVGFRGSVQVGLTKTTPVGLPEILVLQNHPQLEVYDWAYCSCTSHENNIYIYMICIYI